MEEPQLTVVEAGITTPTQPRHRRFGVLGFFFVFVIGLTLVRSFYIQVVHGFVFRERAEANRVTTQLVVAPRGIIYDRDGVMLVENTASTDAVLDPLLLPDRTDEHILLDTLPHLLHVHPDVVQRALETARTTQRSVVVGRALEHEIVIALEESLDQLPGVRLVSSSVRRYPYAHSLSHVLGYTGPVSSDDLAADADLVLIDSIGKDGLEKIYDRSLRGLHGALLEEVDAAGHSLRSVGQRDPFPGNDLALSLDVDLQEFVFSVLAEHDGKSRDNPQEPVPSGATVVVLDPRDGAVRALVSYPGFDPNTFSQPAQQDNAASWFSDERTPLLNRATSGMYPPGSTIKPLLACAALQEGIITPESTVLSTGGIRIGQWFFPDWRAGGHGLTDLAKAIADSVNTYFYIVAGGDETHDGLGVTRATEYLSAFGLGSPTGIDLPGEQAGFLPSPAWKEATKGEPWYIGDTYHLGIGQGDVLVTPLQLAVATSAIANGGTLYHPYLVAEQRSLDGAPEPHQPVGQSVGIDPAHLAAVRAAMRSTVTDGSARRLSSLTLPLAGKTGTAQVGGSDDTHAWFTSFGPVEYPELVVTVLLERGGEGDHNAVPIAQEIWQWIEAQQGLSSGFLAD